VGSSPTPGAKLLDSSEDFINEKQQINIVHSLQEPLTVVSIEAKERQEIEKQIDLICKHQKQFTIKSLKRILENSIENTKIICDYIIAEQNEINIKESTKEGKIKVPVDFIIFNNYKSLEKITKVDVLSYLNKFRKDEQEDPEHRRIGTWNNRHLILNKFFRWLNDSDNPNIKNRKASSCMKGVKRLSRKEISRYKPSDLWTARESEVFLKYCPSKRDRAFFSMAMDTSARPHELLNLKIDDLKFKTSSDGSKQYAEITINGKTGQRTVPLINSLPHIKEWILNHPLSNDKKYWIFISEGKSSFGNKLTRDGLLKHFQEYYKQKYYPNLLLKDEISEADKAYIKNLLSKPWNLYVFRHSALTEKSQILNEHMLINHAGWTTTSKMPQVYIHHLGNASLKQLLQSFGIIEKDKESFDSNTINKKIRICPNCNEPNKAENRFCFKCKMILSFDSYSEIRTEDKNKIEKLENDMESLKEGMNKIFLIIQQNPTLINIKPEVLGKMIK
jgi:integrase